VASISDPTSISSRTFPCREACDYPDSARADRITRLDGASTGRIQHLLAWEHHGTSPLPAAYGVHRSARAQRLCAYCHDCSIGKLSRHGSTDSSPSSSRLASSNPRWMHLCSCSSKAVTQATSCCTSTTSSSLPRRQHYLHTSPPASNPSTIKDLGPLRFILGLDVQRHKDGFHLSQAAYAQDVLECAGSASCALQSP
jgi:hypothetical protein